MIIGAQPLRAFMANFSGKMTWFAWDRDFRWFRLSPFRTAAEDTRDSRLRAARALLAAANCRDQGRSRVPRLSILIPCLGGAAEFDSTLVSVLQNRPAKCEVIVLHPQKYDDPYGLSDEVDFVRVSEARTITRLVNEGLRIASGDVVHIVGCGLQVEEGWTEPAMRHFRDGNVAAVAPLMNLQGQEIAGACFSRGGRRTLVSNGSAPAKAFGPTLMSGFFRNEILQATKGFEESLGDELADVSLALTLERLRFKIVFEARSRLIADEKPVVGRSNPFKVGSRAERLYRRHAAWRGLVGSRLAHPFAVAHDAIAGPAGTGFLRLIGRLGALADRSSAEEYEKWLDQVRQRLESDESPTISVMPRQTGKPVVDSTAPSRRKAA